MGVRGWPSVDAVCGLSRGVVGGYVRGGRGGVWRVEGRRCAVYRDGVSLLSTCCAGQLFGH
jgi:hypothetical protein